MATSTIAFDHIALALYEIALAPEFLVGELGGVPGYGAPSGEFTFFHWDFEGTGRIEILEPLGPPGGFVHRFLSDRGAGIHHTTFKVPDLRKVCDRAESLGYTIVGYNDSDPGWQEAFLHPKQAMGVVVQFAQASGSDGDSEDSLMQAPAAPANPPLPATIVGIRMVTSDRERAIRQWSEVLQGELDDRGDELIFTWPETTMRVSVTIEPGASDRSDCVEVRADRPLALPAGAHPVLGTRFVEVK